MRTSSRVALSCLAASVALGAASASASAAPKRITGKLTKSGYTVIALAANGKASSVSGRGRRFALRPPARRVTLHLRARGGRYAGPVVVGRKKEGRVALLGVRAGARLGRVRVRRGYATLAKRLPRNRIDTSRGARASKGVPIGARRFGRVRSRAARRGGPGDRDLDGIPNPLDIDDDGDLILDSLDRSRSASAAQALQEFGIHTLLVIPFQDTVNVNAGSTDEQIDAALTGAGRSERGGRLNIKVLSGDSAELDCGGTVNPAPPPPRLGGLVYCSSGGTGGLFAPGSDLLTPFPDCCDADADGFGTLRDVLGSMTFAHRATAAQIQTGDLLIQRVTSSGVESQFTAAIEYIFVTVPALVSYSDTAGNSGTIPYPTTTDSPLPVAAGPDGRVVLTLTFWRPQRRRLETDPPPGPGESGTWTDIGGLAYEAGIADVEGVPGGAGGSQCPQSAFSTADPNLLPTPPSWSTEAGGFTDRAPDRPASAANTFTYTLDVSQCLPPGVSWDPNRTVGLDFFARTDTPANASQSGVPFERK